MTVPTFDKAGEKRLHQKYQGIEERFYTKTSLPIITPDNAMGFLEHLKSADIHDIDIQEHFRALASWVDGLTVRR